VFALQLRSWQGALNSEAIFDFIHKVIFEYKLTAYLFSIEIKQIFKFDKINANCETAE
jgi:hypothetical protein